MEAMRSPEVVREKISRVGGGRLTCALIFDREFAREEIVRFYAQKGDGDPVPTDFEIAGRVIRYDCLESEEAKWRLAVEILLVKAFRPPPKRRPADTDARRKMGLPPLYR